MTPKHVEEMDKRALAGASRIMELAAERDAASAPPGRICAVRSPADEIAAEQGAAKTNGMFDVAEHIGQLMQKNQQLRKELDARAGQATMSDLQQMLAMLDRAKIGYGLRYDFPCGTSVQVESSSDEKFIVAEFGFDGSGNLKEATCYSGNG